MPDRFSMQLSQNQRQTLKQAQRMMMLPQMQQALALLQMPVMELAEAIEIEMEQNPVLETEPELEASDTLEREGQDDLNEKELQFDQANFEILKALDEAFGNHFTQDEIYNRKTSEDARRQTFKESLIYREESLRDFLMQQSREAFEDPQLYALAELLIDYLDENGYLSAPCIIDIAKLHHCSPKMLEDVLREIQTFDPPGIGARGLKESFLLQLARKQKQGSLAYRLVRDFWDDLLRCRISAMAKQLGVSATQISQIISDEIAKLDLHPAGQFGSAPRQDIVPDVTVYEEGDKLLIAVNDEPLPTLSFNHRYLRMLEDPALSSEVKEFIKQKLGSARWLQRSIDQRSSTLFRITELLTKSQREYLLLPQGQLKPLTMKMIAEELDIHESTVARAVAHKYLQSPRGILPLRSFFTNAYTTETGQQLSSKTVRKAVEDLISKENKTKPLSDDALSRLLKTQGIHCARRTVAKYRDELHIGNVFQRRVYLG